MDAVNGMDLGPNFDMLSHIDHLMLVANGLASMYLIETITDGVAVGSVYVEPGQGPDTPGIRLNAYLTEAARQHPNDVRTVGPISTREAEVLLRQALDSGRPSPLG